MINAAEDDNDGTVTVTTDGAEDGQTVTVALNGTDYTGTVSGDSAAITIPAAEFTGAHGGHSYSLTANVSDAAGNAAAQNDTTSFAVDVTAPTIGTVTTSWGSVINAAEDDSDGTVTVTTVGAEDGQTVTVALNGQSYTGDVSGGSVAITIPAADLQALTDDSTYSLTANVSDAAGNAAVPDTSISFDVDLKPTIEDVSTSWGNVLNGAEDDNSGTVAVTTSGAEDGQAVTVALKGTDYTGSVVSDVAVITIPASDLQNLTDLTTYSLTVDVSTAAGKAADQHTSTDFRVDILAPIINAVDASWGSVINATDDDSDGTVTVTTSDVENGQKVTVTLDAKSYTGTVTGNSAAITIPAADLQALTEGDTYNLTADVSDVDGNPADQHSVTSFAVDVTAPTIETVTTSWGSVINAAEDDNDGVVTVTTDGVENDQTVTVALNGQSYNVTVTSYNMAITIPAADLQALTDDSTYSLTADVSDAAGNAAAQNDTTSFAVDVTAPTIGTVTTSWGSVINAAEDDSDGTVTVTTVGVEDDQTVTVALNGTDYTGDVSGGSAAITIPAASLQALTEGISYSLTANVSDAAGNAAAQNDTTSFAVDVTAPTIEAVSASWGNAVNAADDDNDGTVTVTTVGVENGQTVTVALNGTDYTGTVSSDSVAITIPAADLQALTDGDTYNLTADVSDAAGNAAAQNDATSFAVDVTAPTIGTVTTSWGSVINAAEDDNDGVVTVTTDGVENDQTVTVALNGQSYNVTVTSYNVAITIPAADLQALTDDSTYSLTANVSDAAGNAAVPDTSISFDVDLKPTIEDVSTSWSDVLNGAEDDSSGTVTVTTSGAENDQIVSVVLNTVNYTGTVVSDVAVITIPASDLQNLTDLTTYSLTVGVSTAAGKAADPHTSTGFLVDITAPTIGTLSPLAGAV